MKHTSDDIYYVVFNHNTDLGHFSTLKSTKTYIIYNVKHRCFRFVWWQCQNMQISIWEISK